MLFPLALYVCLLGLAWAFWRRREILDRNDALFWYVLSLCLTWAGVFIALIPSQEYASMYGRNVLVLSALIAIIAGGSGVVVYALWPVRPLEAVPVASNAEKLRALSPIHMMIMAIERVSPREASFGPHAGDGIGRFVRYDTPNLDFDKVRSVFSEYAHVLGDHHLKEWLKFNEEIREYQDRGGFYVGKREWKWFNELEKEYRETVDANLPPTAPEIEIKRREFTEEDVGPPFPLESVASFVGVPNFEEMLQDWLRKKLPSFCNVQVKSMDQSQDWSEVRGMVQDSDLSFYRFTLRVSAKGKIDKKKSYVNDVSG